MSFEQDFYRRWNREGPTQGVQAQHALITISERVAHASTLKGPELIEFLLVSLMCTQSDLARYSGLSSKTISSIKNGNAVVSKPVRSALYWAICVHKL